MKRSGPLHTKPILRVKLNQNLFIESLLQTRADPDQSAEIFQLAEGGEVGWGVGGVRVRGERLVKANTAQGFYEKNV